jgi:RNA polymerase-binding transcription factor DksA
VATLWSPTFVDQTKARGDDRDRHHRSAAKGTALMAAVKKSPPAKKKSTSAKKAAPAKNKAAAAKKKVVPARKPVPVKKAAPAKKKAAAPNKKVAPVKKAAPAKKVVPIKKAAPAKKVAPIKKAAPAKKAVAEPAVAATAPAKAAPAAKAAPKPPPKPTRGPYASEPKFLEEQRKFLLEEREIYKTQAADLRAEADSLALDREPGDVQFDEESGEGGTVAVDRERDLTLSAQALSTIEEIDIALRFIETKMYGACESCGQPIPKTRLRALPYARLCVSCKSGGLHRR